MIEAIKSPIEMMYQWEKETPNKVFLRQPSNLIWQEYTWKEVADQVRRLAQYLYNKNYPKGSRIAIWSSNSKDWVIADLAIMLSGHISVPIYPGQDTESASYVLEHSEAKLLFAGSFDQAKTMQKTLLPNTTTVAMHGCTVNCDTSITKIIDTVAPFTESPIPDLDDVFTIIYTSGTTGNPKGVMHMHRTPGHVVPGIMKAFKMVEENSHLFSFLPMAHAAERIIIEMAGIYSNSSISFSEGLATFGDEIRSVQPTFFFAVPRLWLKFKEGIDVNIPAEQQRLLTDEQKKGIATALGLSNARIIITGSSPCPRDVQDWFLNMDIQLRDAYGMTENFVHGLGWMSDEKPKSGCVGKTMTSDIEVKLSDEGEILFRSAGLMKGYYKAPGKTAEVIIDGWYHTGDSGKFDEQGDMWVTGRIKETFKTTRGKFIVPTKIENLLSRGNELSQLCIFGHGLDQPILLATLSELGATMSFTDLERDLENLLDEVNAELNSWETISRIAIVPEWTIDNAMLTPTMKLKRNRIEDSYRDRISSHPGTERVINFT